MGFRAVRYILLFTFLLVLFGLSASEEIAFSTFFISDVEIEQDEIPSFDIDLAYAFNEITAEAIHDLYLFRRTEDLSADITIHPHIESIIYTHDTTNAVEVLELFIRWDVAGEFGIGSLSFRVLGAAGTVNGALLSSLDMYQRAIGYEIVSQLSEQDILMVSSTFNGYVTGIIPETAVASVGDEFFISDPSNSDELALLTLSSLRDPLEGEKLSGEYYINYSEVPIQPGISLIKNNENQKISVKISEIQTLSFTGLSGKVFFRRPTGAIQYSAGIDMGYSWNDSALSLSWPVEAKGFHLGLNQGFLVRFDQGLRLQKDSSRSRYALFLDIGADLGLGYFTDTSGSDTDWIYYGSYHAGLGWYSSSAVEYGVDLGYQLTYGFSDGSTPLRSTPYVSPHVTFRL